MEVCIGQNKILSPGLVSPFWELNFPANFQLVENDVVLDFLNILSFNKNYFTFGPRRYQSLTRESQLFLHKIFPIS